MLATRHRGISTGKSPLEEDYAYQKALEEREAALKEMRAASAAIEASSAESSRSAPSSSSSAPPAAPPKPKPKPKPPAFGVLSSGGARAPTKPAEKPKPKTTVVRAPTLGRPDISSASSGGIAGPAGNRNLMPAPPPEPEEPEIGQGHLRDILQEGSFEKYGVGGLDAEFMTIFRRVFASRMVAPDVVRRLGMRHVKGMLLYGPPGTGKTLVAKQLGKLLNAHPPKIVNGPEILQRFVGQSEENMRDLFAPAEKEFKGKGDKSKLHVIIFDEIDAIMKARGSGGAAASVVHDNVVNQLLTKLDGMQSLDNVLVVGITNRRDLLDPAVLRPGRLELQVEVGLPDERGRRQIFNIHTAAMRAGGMLAADVDVDALAATTGNYSGAEIKGLVGAAQSHALARYLAASGNENENKNENENENENENAAAAAAAANVVVTADDFERAAREVRPAMGADEAALSALRPLGMHCSCDTGSAVVSRHKRARDAIAPLLRAVSRSVVAVSDASASAPKPNGPDHITVLLHGPPGSGKTAAAAEASGFEASGFPHVKVFRAELAVANGPDAALHALRVAFDDAAKAPLSLLVIDSLEILLGIAVGEGGDARVAAGGGGAKKTSSGTTPCAPPHAELLQTLHALLRRPPPPGRKLAVLATTSSIDAMRRVGVSGAFHAAVEVPPLSRDEAARVLATEGAFGAGDHDAAVVAAEMIEISASGGNGDDATTGVAIKRLLRAAQLARALTSASGGNGGDVVVDPRGGPWLTALERGGVLRSDVAEVRGGYA